MTTTAPGLEPLTVNSRIKIAGLWTAMLMVFAYVDLFSLYRPDVRAAIGSGQIIGLAIDQGLLLAMTIYILIPSLMIVGSLVLRPRLARGLNLGLSAVYALTVIGAAMGEWTYYLVGSAVEVVLLGFVAHYAWSWPRTATAPAAAGSVPTRGAFSTLAG